MHGRNLSALLKNPEGTLSEPMLMINTIYMYGTNITENLKKQNCNAFERNGLYAWLMMRYGHYKYIRHFKDNVIEELYDMAKDPDELINLAVNAEYGKKLAELRRKALEEFQKKDGDFVAFLPEPGKL